MKKIRVGTLRFSRCLFLNSTSRKIFINNGGLGFVCPRTIFCLRWTLWCVTVSFMYMTTGNPVTGFIGAQSPIPDHPTSYRPQAANPISAPGICACFNTDFLPRPTPFNTPATPLRAASALHPTQPLPGSPLSAHQSESFGDPSQLPLTLPTYRHAYAPMLPRVAAGKRDGKVPAGFRARRWRAGLDPRAGCKVFRILLFSNATTFTEAKVYPHKKPETSHHFHRGQRLSAQETKDKA